MHVYTCTYVFKSLYIFIYTHIFINAFLTSDYLNYSREGLSEGFFKEKHLQITYSHLTSLLHFHV